MNYQGYLGNADDQFSKQRQNHHLDAHAQKRTNSLFAANKNLGHYEDKKYFEYAMEAPAVEEQNSLTSSEMVQVMDPFQVPDDIEAAFD